MKELVEIIAKSLVDAKLYGTPENVVTGIQP